MNLLRQFTIAPVKKHISLLTALLILVSNSGLAFSVHYCEGKIASISSVFSQEKVCEMEIKVEDSCCAKPQKTHKDCCSDKKVNLKSKTEKIVIKAISLDFQVAYFSEYKNHIFKSVVAEKRNDENPAFHYDSNAPPLYKLYCQYTFYA